MMEKLAQQGTHTELIGQQGIYKHFIEIREKAEDWSIDKEVEHE